MDHLESGDGEGQGAFTLFTTTSKVRLSLANPSLTTDDHLEGLGRSIHVNRRPLDEPGGRVDGGTVFGISQGAAIRTTRPSSQLK